MIDSGKLKSVRFHFQSRGGTTTPSILPFNGVFCGEMTFRFIFS
jgi:hypothetical protein